MDGKILFRLKILMGGLFFFAMDAAIERKADKKADTVLHLRQINTWKTF